MTIGQILSRSLGKPQFPEESKSLDNDHKTKSNEKGIKKSPSMRLITASRSIINKLTVKNQTKLASPAIISKSTFPAQSALTPKNNSKSSINNSSSQDSDDLIQNIIMPYYNYKVNDTSNPEIYEKSRSNSIKTSNTLKDMIRESSIYKFEESESIMPQKQATVELPSTPKSNLLPNLSSISPIQNSNAYSNNSIFGNLDAVSFDENILSRSTSRHESLFYRTDMVTDVSSVKDANIQIYKPYNIPSLKIIKQQEDLANSLRNEGGEDINDHESNRATFRLSSIYNLENEIEYKDQGNTDYDIIANYGNLDTTKKEEENENGEAEDDEFHFSNDADSSYVYKKELQLLAERHKLIVEKQQCEIQYLKQLLFEERKLNNYLASQSTSTIVSPVSNSSANSSPSEFQSIKVKKVRSKFIPLDIISHQNIKQFHLQPPNLEFAKPRPSPIYHSSQTDSEFDKTSFDINELSEESIRKPSFSSSIFSEADYKKMQSRNKDMVPSISSSYTIHSSPGSFVFNSDHAKASINT
ncbi:hypothetical protein DFJ63DRAFT_335162 [Scheffersomyces coipomensis]|uniref:uncharacterized protein n=1 Tax=Scheffersomyces coipomensis TaxID=1788519 RepID=UPI00315D371D